MNRAEPARSDLRVLHFGPNDAIFGALDVPAEGAEVRSSVALFPPFGHEAVWGHRALRELALRLAESGHAVLRFDPRGTGESLGESGDLTFEDWIADGRAALGWLAARFPNPRAIGLRLGGTLAALAGGSADREVALWQPVVDGPRYLDQLRGIQTAHAKEWGWTPPTTRNLEALGFELSAAHRSYLESLTAQRVAQALDGARVLHLSNGEDEEQRALAGALAGSHVLRVKAAEPRIWNTEPYRTFLPVASYEALLDWMADREGAA